MSGRRLLLILGFSLLITAVSCTPSHPQSTFDVTGPIASGQRDLFSLMFWLAVIVFILVEGILVYAIFRYRKKSDGDMPAQVHGNTRMEIAWTIAPALLLIVVMVPTIQKIFEHASPPDNSYEIAVIGHQWWWEFEYLDCGPVDCAGLVTANELHIPAGQPVNFTLVSEDVIHAFWVPKIGGKRDVLPVPKNSDGKLDLVHQRANQLWLQGDVPGEYYGQCAELCGVSHANMRFRVHVDDRDTFAQWVSNQKSPNSLPSNTDPSYQKLTTLCAACHAITGTTLTGVIGPDLSHYGTRTTLASSMFDNTPENLKSWLRDPGAMKPGNIMAGSIKPGTLSEEEIEALADYLLGLR